MSSILDSAGNLKPVYEAKPDMRFATTFISNKYRDYAVKGESLQDKITGELFTKRREDGRVVSFFHNKKYLQDTMLELRISLINNPSFTYPDKEDYDAHYISIDYDAMSLFNDTEVNVKGQVINIDNSSEHSRHHVEFLLSKKTNGFYVTCQTRDCDKALIEWLGTQYNILLANYQGENPELQSEHMRFEYGSRWSTNDSIINYTIELLVDGEVMTFNFDEYVRFNETSCVQFPTNFDMELVEDSEYVRIYINSIDMHKANFVLSHLGSFPAVVPEGIEKFIAVDNQIQLRMINVSRFMDSVKDIELLGNEFICTLIDMPYVYSYMMRMSKLADNSSIFFSPTRPGDEIWESNTIWAEHVREVYKGGVETNMNSEVDLKALENYLATNDDTDYVRISDDPVETEEIYGEEV